MYRPRDDMTKTTKGDKNAPDDPYLPIPGSLPDRFMRSYTKLMRHPRSRPARETARATFPHYIADVLDRHCADAYPDDNPADQARTITVLAYLFPAIVMRNEPYVTLDPPMIVDVYTDLVTLGPYEFAERYDIADYEGYLYDDVEYQPLPRPPDTRNPYQQLADHLCPEDRNKGEALLDTAILTALNRQKASYLISDSLPTIWLVAIPSAIAAIFWKPLVVPVCIAGLVIAAAQAFAVLLRNQAHRTSPAIAEWTTNNRSPEIGDFAHAYWHPAKRHLHRTRFLGMRLWRRKPLTKGDYHHRLANRLKHARTDDTTRQLIDFIEQGEDL